MVVKSITRIASVLLLVFSLYQFGLNVSGYYRDLPVQTQRQILQMQLDIVRLQAKEANPSADTTAGDTYNELSKLNLQVDRFRELNEVLVSLIAVILSFILFELAFRNENRGMAT